MKPILSDTLLEVLRTSGKPPPWKCKLHLRRGRTIYGVEVAAGGEITRLGDRTIYSATDISFGLGAVESVSL